MFLYFVLFTSVGFIVSSFSSNNENQIFISFVVIAILWAFIAGFIWGIVAFGEMFVGYFIYKTLFNKTE